MRLLYSAVAPRWFGWLGAAAALAGVALALRAVALTAIRIAFASALERAIVDRAGLGADQPPGELVPFTTYVKGFRWGMRQTIAGTVDAWAVASAYERLVAAEGIGMAFRLRRALWLGSPGADAFTRVLPPTVAMGVGVYHAMVSGIRDRVPAELLQGAADGWRAFLRVESYFFGLVVTRYRAGAIEENRALIARLCAIATADEERGFALATGMGRAMHFVIHDPDARMEAIDQLDAGLRRYARVGLGIPLLNTASDDVGRLARGLSAYPAAARNDIVAGLSLFLAFAARYAGEDWLEGFGGLTDDCKTVLRHLEATAAEGIRRHGPVRDLQCVRRIVDHTATRGLGPQANTLIATAPSAGVRVTSVAPASISA